MRCSPYLSEQEDIFKSVFVFVMQWQIFSCGQYSLHCCKSMSSPLKMLSPFFKVFPIQYWYGWMLSQSLANSWRYVTCCLEEVAKLLKFSTIALLLHGERGRQTRYSMVVMVTALNYCMIQPYCCTFFITWYKKAIKLCCSQKPSIMWSISSWYVVWNNSNRTVKENN